MRNGAGWGAWWRSARRCRAAKWRWPPSIIRWAAGCWVKAPSCGARAIPCAFPRAWRWGPSPERAASAWAPCWAGCAGPMTAWCGWRRRACPGWPITWCCPSPIPACWFRGRWAASAWPFCAMPVFNRKRPDLNFFWPRLRWLRSWTLALVALPAIGSLSACGTVGYYAQAIQGHFAVMHAARPVEEVVGDPAVPAAVRDKLVRIQAMRDFAVRELGEPDNGSYRRYADLHRPFVVWNVIATPEFSTKPIQSCFPIAG